MVMCRGRLCHSVWLYFLLIAVAIQGVTPDADDLASLNCLFLFCPSLADSKDLADDDGLPDEVCGPVRPETDAVLRGNAQPNDPANPLFLSSEDHHQLTIQLRALRSDARGGKHPRLNDLNCSLCRLKC
jgi:hypothetical protein